MTETSPQGVTSPSVEALIAKLFIARPEIKAKQWESNGRVGYSPVESKFSRSDLTAHLSGDVTYGHYLSDTNEMCKLITFDVDISSSPEAAVPDLNGPDFFDPEAVPNWTKGSALAIWRDRKDSRRAWIKHNFKSISHRISEFCLKELDLPCRTAYTGNKGIHVYAFFKDRVHISDAHDAAQVVLESLGYKRIIGQNFYGRDVPEELPHSVEIFPKQTQLTGKGYGNLVRLPLGKNLKSPKDPTFFIETDLSKSPMSEFLPVDPVDTLACLRWPV